MSKSTRTRMDFEFTANTWSWRAALRSTLPHIGSEKVTPSLCRLRVSVTAAGVFVAATDRYTMALARVRMVDDAQPAVLGCFDLDPDAAKLLLAVFKPGKDDDDPRLRFEVTEKRLTATDAAGMFDGRTLAIAPTPPHPAFPDLARVIAGMWPRRGPVGVLSAASDYAGRFARSAAEHSGVLLIEPVIDGRSVIITSGDDFVGVLMCRGRADDELDHVATLQERWGGEFRAISQVAPAVPVDPPRANPDDVEAEEKITPVDLTNLLERLDEGPSGGAS